MFLINDANKHVMHSPESYLKRNIPEDAIPCSHRSENFKSYTSDIFVLSSHSVSDLQFSSNQNILNLSNSCHGVSFHSTRKGFTKANNTFDLAANINPGLLAHFTVLYVHYAAILILKK
jgi:hypothetical protein